MSQPARRPLGATDVRVSPIGLGCMGMSEFHGSADEASNIACCTTRSTRA